MPTHAEDSLRKIFDSKYAASQSPWTILTNANILGQNKHTIITRQAVVPSCFSQVTHAKVDERQTFSLYKSTFASDMHWFSSVDDITPMPGHGLTTKKTGFLASCMGHSTKIEDASTKLCCRDERDVGYTILALDSAGMTFAGELAMSSFYDCHIQAEDIFNAQPTGDESAFPVHFTCTLEPKGVAGLMPGDKVIKMHDMCSLMFLDNCFVMYRAMLNMHRQDNPIMKGCFWQVGTEHVYMAYNTLNEAEIAMRISAASRDGGSWEQHILGGEDSSNNNKPVSSRHVVDTVRDIIAHKRSTVMLS